MCPPPRSRPRKRQPVFLILGIGAAGFSKDEARPVDNGDHYVSQRSQIRRRCAPRPSFLGALRRQSLHSPSISIQAKSRRSCKEVSQRTILIASQNGELGWETEPSFLNPA